MGAKKTSTNESFLALAHNAALVDLGSKLFIAARDMKARSGPKADLSAA